MRTVHMCAPQAMQTHFGQKRFIDEVTQATGMDSVAFRLKLMQDLREIDGQGDPGAASCTCYQPERAVCIEHFLHERAPGLGKCRQ